MPISENVKKTGRENASRPALEEQHLALGTGS
jgi:hypothetical protein